MYSDGLLKLPIFTIQKNFKILLTVYSLSPPEIIIQVERLYMLVQRIPLINSLVD